MTYKELTKVKISDSSTYALIHGILLITKNHPGTSTLLGYDQNVTLNISESNRDMGEEDVKLLQSWGWQRSYYAEIDETYWTFQMKMVEK